MTVSGLTGTQTPDTDSLPIELCSLCQFSKDTYQDLPALAGNEEGRTTASGRYSRTPKPAFRIPMPETRNPEPEPETRTRRPHIRRHGNILETLSPNAPRAVARWNQERGELSFWLRGPQVIS